MKRKLIVWNLLMVLVTISSLLYSCTSSSDTENINNEELLSMYQKNTALIENLLDENKIKTDQGVIISDENLKNVSQEIVDNLMIFLTNYTPTEKDKEYHNKIVCDSNYFKKKSINECLSQIKIKGHLELYHMILRVINDSSLQDFNVKDIISSQSLCPVEKATILLGCSFKEAIKKSSLSCSKTSFYINNDKMLAAYCVECLSALVKGGIGSWFWAAIGHATYTFNQDIVSKGVYPESELMASNR